MCTCILYCTTTFICVIIVKYILFIFKRDNASEIYCNLIIRNLSDLTVYTLN